MLGDFTIICVSMVFLIQQSQNKDVRYLKLNGARVASGGEQYR